MEALLLSFAAIYALSVLGADCRHQVGFSPLRGYQPTPTLRHRWSGRRSWSPAVLGVVLILGGACGGGSGDHSEAGAPTADEEWNYEDSSDIDDEGQFTAFDDFEKHAGSDSYDEDFEEEIPEDDWDARSERARKGIEDFNRRRK